MVSHCAGPRRLLTNRSRSRDSDQRAASRREAASARSSPSSSASSIARRKAASAAATSTSTVETPNDSPSSVRDSACPSSRLARSSIAVSPTAAARRDHPARQLRGRVLVVRRREAPRRAAAGRQARASVSRRASASAPSSASPSSRSVDRRRTAKASSRVASSMRRSAGRRDDRQRRLDQPQRLLWRVRLEGRRRGIDRKARRPLVVARGEGVLGEHRQALGRRLAALEQQVDHGPMDLAPPRVRELGHGEVPDLLVGERVVGRVALGCWSSRPAWTAGASASPIHSGRPGLRSRAAPDRLEVANAKSSAQGRRPRPATPSVGAGQPGRPSRDERPHGPRHEPRRVPPEPPLPLDLLQRAGLAMGPRQLLDDERHALRLGVHRGDGLPLDRPAEHLAQQQPRLGGREPGRRGVAARGPCAPCRR